MIDLIQIERIYNSQESTIFYYVALFLMFVGIIYCIFQRVTEGIVIILLAVFFFYFSHFIQKQEIQKKQIQADLKFLKKTGRLPS